MKPKINVLMATYNGAAYVVQQIESILQQVNVDIEILISDDNSTDGTPSLLSSFTDPRVTVLPNQTTKFSNAHKNFMRLIIEAESNADFYAFSDQDDLWFKNKLQRAVFCIENNLADGYSSNVLAFWPDGKSRVINKAQELKKFDYMFESAGPGCTFVLSRNLFLALKKFVVDSYPKVAGLKIHDWFIYAFARSNGWMWYIDMAPSLMYRQHSNNVIGANVGFRPAVNRFHEIFTGKYFEDVLAIANAIAITNTFVTSLSRRSASDFLWLSINATKFRRKFSDSLVLSFCFLLCIFLKDRRLSK